MNIPLEENMLRNRIKALLKKTPIYPYILKYRKIQESIRWNHGDKRSLKFYRQFLKQGDLVFDVGANVGNRTEIFLKLGARVVAFEPQNKCSDILEAKFKGEKSFTLIKKALGAEDGEAEMFISNDHTISTLSKNWINEAKQSRRFNQSTWNDKQYVQVTSLDRVIQKYGLPDFMKIDVEGYEYEVLSGLSQPIKCLSIEYAAENIQNTYKCIEYLNSLSNISFQVTRGETMEYYLMNWVSIKELHDILTEIIAHDTLAWGDIYIRNLENLI